MRISWKSAYPADSAKNVMNGKFPCRKVGIVATAAYRMNMPFARNTLLSLHLRTANAQAASEGGEIVRYGRRLPIGRFDLTADDFQTLETGVCPKRVNGTMFFKNGKISHINLREPPVVDAGKALAKAIRAYAIKYHEKP